MVSTRALIESSLLTAVAIVLILISIYIPIFYFIGLFMWPLPVALVQIKHGYKYSLLSLIATTIITFIFTDPYTALGFAITNGVLGIVFGTMIKRKERAINTIFIMIIVDVISVAISIKIFGLIAGQDYIKLILDEFYKSIDVAKSFYERMGVQKDVYENIFKAMPSKEMLLMLIPFALFMHGFLSAIITYVLAKGIYSRFGIKLEEIPKFSNWFIPVKLAFSIILLVLIAYILAYLKVRNADAYLLNAMYLMLLTFFINGLAALSFWLDKQNLPKGFKIFILLFVFFSLGNILFLIGIVDYSLNLRKLDKSRIKDSPK